MFKNVKKEQITVPAQMSYLIEVRDFIENIGKKHRFDEKVVNSFKLVIDEACTNIIRHGYRDIKNGEIVIKAIARRLSLTIVIIDQGISYDPRQANTPDLEKYVNIGKKGGLGILMMRKLMDDIQYSVTEQGNEFRLTKYRESQTDSWLLNWVHELNLKAKYSFVASIVFTVIVLLFLVPLYLGIELSVEEDILNKAVSSIHSLSENSREDLVSDNNLLLFEKTHSTYISNKNIYSDVFITNPQDTILAWGNTAIIRLEEHYTIPERHSRLDTIENVVVLNYQKNDTTEVYDLKIDIEIGNQIQIGQAHIFVERKIIEDIITTKKLQLLLISVLILAIGYVALFILISNILSSFQSLADWVRQVVHGKVDQDEIDIDTSDELGEIAQAFNEMTSKFREAQVTLIEQQKLQKELQVAQEIQQMLLPSDFPKVEGYEIASYYEAAKEVGGDLFDFVEIDDHSIGICVADVSGKGVPGSMIMTMIRTALRLESRGNKNPAEVLARVNRFVADDMKRGMFVTMFYMVLDSRNRVIHYASAGHNPMILYRGSTKQTYYLNPSGFPVGIQLPELDLFDKKIETDSIRLKEDDVLVLYTDGITEAMNHKRELYREERFITAVRDNSHLEAGDFVQEIHKDIKKFTGGAPQNDDITFVSVRERMMQGEVLFGIHKELTDLIESGIKVKDALAELQVSPHFYYKYKEIVGRKGWEGLKQYLQQGDFIENKHISIEAKTKIFDIIRKHPDYGAARIAGELRSEEYGNLRLDSGRIYKELKKLRLNTQVLRQRFLEKGGKKRIKQPGTPLLTLDGGVILDFESSENEIAKRGKGVESSKQFEQLKQEEERDDRYVQIKSTPNVQVSKPAPHKKPLTPAPVIPETPQPLPGTEVKGDIDAAISADRPLSREDLLQRVALNMNQDELTNLFRLLNDDLEAVEVQVNELDDTKDLKASLKKINLILKIVLKHPSLRKLPDVERILRAVQNVYELMYENAGRVKSNILISISKDLLYYLKKDDKFNDQEKYYEAVNKLGFLQRKLQNKLSKPVDDGLNEMEKVRQKLVQSKIVRKKIKLNPEN